MLDRVRAETLLLESLNSPSAILERGDRFVVSTAELSPNADYWVIRANSEAYVREGDFSRCYVGVNAYLVNIHTGEIETVGSIQSVEDYLQDKYDDREAKGLMYVLGSGYNETDKKAIIRLHSCFNARCQSRES